MDVELNSGTYRVSEALVNRLRAVPKKKAAAVRAWIEGHAPAPAPDLPQPEPVKKKKKLKIKPLNPRPKAKKEKREKAPKGRFARHHRQVGGAPLLLPESVKLRKSLIIKRK
jgi:hypothetical protein